MKDVSDEDIVEKFDLLQKIVWDIDEKTRRNIEIIAEQQLEISEIRISLRLIKEKLDKLETEISILKKDKEVKNG